MTDLTPEQAAILALLDRVEALERIIRRKAMANFVRNNPPAPIRIATMSNLDTHEAEQAAITAQWEASRAHITPCERALQIMQETEAQAAEEGDYPNSRRAARALLAVYPAYDDDDTLTAISDVLSDIMHLCDAAGWDFSDIQTKAHRNYLREVNELGPAADPNLAAAIERN